MTDMVGSEQGSAGLVGMWSGGPNSRRQCGGGGEGGGGGGGRGRREGEERGREGEEEDRLSFCVEGGARGRGEICMATYT